MRKEAKKMILDEIVLKTKEDLEQRKKDYPLEWLGRSLAYNNYPPRDVIAHLKATNKEPYRLICEVKKASPSKGVIEPNFDPLKTAQSYEKGGANAISVLTEPHFFQGNIEYLTQIRRYVATPLLRKDFIIDKYQLVEALVYGADFVLLIAKILSSKELKALLEYTRHLGMEALVEIHDKEDLTKAIYAGATIIGVNHRNLEDFSMNMKLSQELIPLMPNGKIIIAESGIENKETIENLSSIGVDGFLIGEHLMRQDDRAQAIKELKKV